MREVLLKKRLGIPAALLVLLVLAGVATAFVVENFTYTTTIEEPLAFVKKDGLVIEHLGESDDIVVAAKNPKGEKAYGIFVNTTVVSGEVSSITCSSDEGGVLVSTEQIENKDVNDDGDMWDAWYNIEVG